MERESLAWAAGFYEGEGSISASISTHKGTRQIVLTVSQKDSEPLFRFQRAVGGRGRVYSSSDGVGYWACGRSQDVRAITSLLSEWLSQRRLAQIDRAWRTYDGWTGRPPSEKCRRGHILAEVGEYPYRKRGIIYRGCVACRDANLDRRRLRVVS